MKRGIEQNASNQQKPPAYNKKFRGDDEDDFG